MQKYTIDEQGRLNMFFLAAPYDGPMKGQDFQGTHFSKNTDFGPLDTAISYLDHNNIAKRHPELANLPGISDRLGVAKREMSTDEGLVYRVIVDESYKYQNMLKRLLEKDILYASTTPYQKSYKVDDKTGEILRYEIIEVSPTWIPANPDAENIFKSIIMEELQMADETNTSATQDAGAGASEVAASETPITDAVTQMFSNESANSNEKSVPEILVDVLAALNTLNAEIASVKANQANQEKSIKDFSLAIPAGFDLIRKNFMATVEDKHRSNVEKDVVNQFQQQATSNGAPGRNLKSAALSAKNN